LEDRRFDVIEVMPVIAQALRMPDEKIAHGFETVVKFVHQLRLGFLFKVDHDVAAENDIHFLPEGKGSIK
jgi:hypothetical protein